MSFRARITPGVRTTATTKNNNNTPEVNSKAAIPSVRKREQKLARGHAVWWVVYLRLENLKNSSLLAQLVERSAFKRICLSKDTEMSGVRAPYEEFFTFFFQLPLLHAYYKFRSRMILLIGG